LRARGSAPEEDDPATVSLQRWPLRLTCVLLSAPLLAQAPAPESSPLNTILGFRRELHGASTHLVVECNGPVEFNYASSDPLDLRLELLGVDASEVSAPEEAWAPEVDSVSVATGPGAPSTLLTLKLREFAPYRIEPVGHDLRLVLNPPPLFEASPGAGPDPSQPGTEPAVPSKLDVEPEVGRTAPGQEPAAPGPRTGGPDPASRVFEARRLAVDGLLAVRIAANGVPGYESFYAEDAPDRIVLDITGAESRPVFSRLEIGVPPVRRVRIGQHAAEPVPVVRVVVDLDRRVPYRVEPDAEGLLLVFEGVRAP